MPVLDAADPTHHDLVAAAQREARRLSGPPPAGSAPASGHADPPGAATGPDVPGYDLVAEIGRGGQGVVYEARHRATGRPVAIKVMRDGPAAGSERRQRFEREIRVLARLRHPSIVAAHESGEAGGWFYSVMDLVEGVPIDRHVHDGGLDVRETLELFARTCDAVHAAHQRGVIHRDLKPANVLVDADGAPRVLDFGLAKLAPAAAAAATGDAATRVTVAGRMLGTIAWASPEQAIGRGDDVDVRTDVYSLGVMLHELLTGRLPYDTTGSVRDALDAIVEGAPTPPSRFDRALRGDVDTIVLTCLAKERERRYESVAALAADVRRHLRGDAIEARRDSRLYLLRRTARRYRVPITIAGLSLAAGLGFGAVMTVLYQDAARRQAGAAAEVQELREELRRLKAALVSPASWRTTFASAERLRALDPGEGEALVRQAWAEASGDVEARQQMLKAVMVADHPRFVRLMDLGMRDPSPAVTDWAMLYLRETTLQDFALDFAAYDGWYERNRDRTVAELEDAAARALAQALRNADDPESLFRGDAIGTRLDGASGVAAAGVAHGLHELLADLLATGEEDRTRDLAADGLAAMDLEEGFVRARLLPLLEDAGEREGAGDRVAAAVVRVLRTNGTTAAVGPLIAFLLAAYEADDRGGLWNAAMALGAIGDPRAIPTMIALIDHDGGYDTVYGVGHFGLAPLTGVQYDESRDGAWWRAWWERNRARYPAVAGLEIPRLELERAPARAAGGAEGAGDAISEPAPEQSLLAGGDPRKRYFLYGPRTGLRTGPADAGAADRPARGPHPLLLVLPGGDGSADFRPFVTNIWREAAPDDMLVAQLVAPRWSAGQFDAVVWPTEGLGWDAARFTTEAFVEAVVDDVAARYDVDRERVWLLAWSSGGPAAYASLVRGPATGAFVAMSVFRPEHVGDLAGAAGTRVHILHSPGDFIAMDFPERARDMLAAAGATTRLETYSGGHGWHGDVFGMIRRGLRWLGEDEEPPGAAGAVEVDRDQ